MTTRRVIGFFLAALLAVVSIPPASACDMGEPTDDHAMAETETELPPCHDSESQAPAEQHSDCSDCLDHCATQAQAALLLKAPLALVALSQAAPPRVLLPVLPTHSSRLFRPPSTTPASSLQDLV